MFSFGRKDHPDDPPNVRLMRTMKFGGKDLQANRDGFLTDNQRRSIQRGQMWGAIFWWIMAVVFASPAIFIATQQAWQNQFGVWALIIASLACVTAAFWQQSKTRRVLKHNQTASVQGAVRRTMQLVYTGKVMIPMFQVIVGDKTFTVPKNVHDAFIEGDDYTLYYVPETNQLLSAEETNRDIAEKEKRLSDDDAEDQTIDYVTEEIQGAAHSHDR